MAFIVIAIAFHLAMPSLSLRATSIPATIEPKIDYGFTYEKRESLWNGQNLLEIRFYPRAKTPEQRSEQEPLIDQLFVLRYKDSATLLNRRVNRYDDAEKLCDSLPALTSETSLEAIDRKFMLPYDYQAFFLIDEGLIQTELPLPELSPSRSDLPATSPSQPRSATLSSGPRGPSIDAFWTQGAFDPNSVSPFKLDSTAGYITDKRYTPGYIFGFEETTPFDTQISAEKLTQERLVQRRSKFESLTKDDTEADAESQQAYAEQIALINQRLEESVKQLALLQVKRDGLEVHCIAGNRLHPEIFLGPLMQKSFVNREPN